jgi:hypothetical protein
MLHAFASDGASAWLDSLSLATLVRLGSAQAPSRTIAPPTSELEGVEHLQGACSSGASLGDRGV